MYKVLTDPTKSQPILNKTPYLSKERNENWPLRNDLLSISRRRSGSAFLSLFWVESLREKNKIPLIFLPRWPKKIGKKLVRGGRAQCRGWTKRISKFLSKRDFSFWLWSTATDAKSRGREVKKEIISWGGCGG